MTPTMPFGDVLDAADRLPAEDQQALIEILQRRLLEARRQRLIADVQGANEEFASGKCLTTTPAELMREILG